MKRSAALLILGVMLAGGWLTGKWLAGSGTAPPQARGDSPHKVAASSRASATPSQSRDFNSEWNTVTAIPDRKKRLGQLTSLCIDWAKVDPEAALKSLLETSAADKDPDRTPINSAFSYFFESWARTHG